MNIFGEKQIVLYNGKTMDGLCFSLHNEDNVIHFTLPLDSENLNSIEEIEIREA